MEVKNTKEFVHYMTVLKEIETSYFENKVSNLNELIKENPNNIVYKYKHQIISNRIKKLFKILEDLKQLKKDLKKV